MFSRIQSKKIKVLSQKLAKLLYTNFHPYRSLANYVQVALPKPSMESCSPTQMKENYQVFCIKHKANGIPERYKARHVENNILKHSEVE